MTLHALHWRRRPIAARVRDWPGSRHSVEFVPTLAKDERLLYRYAPDGRLTAVATDTVVHWRLPGGAWQRMSYADIVSARWLADQQMIGVQTSASGRTQVVRIAGNAGLAALIEERRTYLRVLSRRVAVAPGVHAVFDATRTRDGSRIEWRVRVEPLERADDPAIRSACAIVLRELRAQTGC